MTVTWKWEELSPLALAFVGDAIWEVYVRNHVLSQGVRRPDILHRYCSKYVRATAQAAIVDRLYEDLTEVEQRIVRKGRNAKPAHSRKSADVLQYRYSTGFEALVGYLYGNRQESRLDEVCGLALKVIDEQEEKRSEP